MGYVNRLYVPILSTIHLGRKKNSSNFVSKFRLEECFKWAIRIWENGKWLKALDYFGKTIHIRSLIRFLIRICVLLSSRNKKNNFFHHRKMISTICISTCSKLKTKLHAFSKNKHRSSIGNCNKYGRCHRSIDVRYINIGKIDER